ncbi:Exocyst subunit Exo70 family protein [Melia azedarach]|uniref:Exocyst subunit Exo70 family protein n=1 Tax=Melia azedarach TaxID=155640 RepID=A0ACC1Y4T5_MELAZ|nr:Exocyst subunit Exo70 family protein [Melia azedarach]
MAKGSLERLVAVRELLNSSLEKSRALDLGLDKTGQRLDEIKERLPSLEDDFRCLPMQKCSYVAVRNQIDSAIGPAAAVLKVYDAVKELEKSLSSESFSDIFSYLSVMKRLEEAIKFLADNCRLAIQWLEGIAQALEGNVAVNHRYNCSVEKCLRILRQLQAVESSARLNGGSLFGALERLESEFIQLVTENTTPFALVASSSSPRKQACTGSSLMPEAVIQKLQPIIERLKAHSRLDNCISSYVEVRSLNIRKCLQHLDLEYLEKSLTEFDDVKDIEGFINDWCKHLELVVKHVFEPEYRLCNDVFNNTGSNVCMRCFAKLAAQSGIHSFIQFAKNVSETKKDPIKLLRLLEIFAALDNLRVDFNRLFGGEANGEIQSLTRDLIKKVVHGACEIFWELPLQVKLQRHNFPPSDGSVPRLVSFVTDYCNQLLADNYKPMLTQILVIHQSWKQEKYEEGLLTSQIYNIIKEIALNLDAWSNSHQDITLSFLFMMNNHCHFCSLRDTKLGDMMGDSWLKAHEQYKNYYAGLYVRECWGKLFALLKQDGILLSPGRKAYNRDLLKKKLKDFNQTFDFMYKKQSYWVVSDENLREKLCQLVVQAFMPVYRSYLQNYGVFIEQDASGSKYVKYTANDLEKMLSSLFQPNLRKSGSSRRSQFIGKIRNVVTHQFHLMLTAS